jgi:hypothetical protein
MPQHPLPAGEREQTRRLSTRPNQLRLAPYPLNRWLQESSHIPL